MTAPGRIRAVTLPIVGKTALAGLAAPASFAAALGEAAAVQREQLQHLVGRFCGTEQIALHLGAAERTEQALSAWRELARELPGRHSRRALAARALAAQSPDAVREALAELDAEPAPDPGEGARTSRPSFSPAEGVSTRSRSTSAACTTEPTIEPSSE